MKRNTKNVAKKKSEKNKAAAKHEKEQEIKQTAEKEMAEKADDKSQEADKIQELESRYNEVNDKYLRLYSEFDNYRKRTIKERLELSKTASEEVIIDLLPVLDDFDRALKSTENIENCDPVKEGMKLIYNKLYGVLDKRGLKPIESIGTPFDTDFHEAITYIPAPSEELKNKVVDEIQKGYKLHDKVIRYTKVVIGQ
ncbi:MAG TPA: nucleotide exchange factor GrpE [Bacteroidales bacterium]|nr:nucleotide exchange factor GrpE [Bacteroidales bacterium]HRX98093.1 nucleotide exchange factor GrpE [Bacteroidales bacterium]